MFLLSSGSGSKSLIVYEKTQYFFLKKWRSQGEETIKYHFDSSTDYWHHMNSLTLELCLGEVCYQLVLSVGIICLKLNRGRKEGMERMRGRETTQWMMLSYHSYKTKFWPFFIWNISFLPSASIPETWKEKWDFSVSGDKYFIWKYNLI